MDTLDRPNVSLHPPTIFFSALIIGFIIRAFAGGWLPLPDIAAEAAGGILIMGGLALAISAVSSFAEAGETLRPATPSNQLLTGGPFNYSRNPIYLAMVIFGVGFGIATENIWIVLTSILTGVIYNFLVIPAEEKYLHDRFGADYAEYKANVRRWL